MNTITKVKSTMIFFLLVFFICFIFYLIIDWCFKKTINLEGDMANLVSLILIIGTVIIGTLSLKKVTFINKYNTYPKYGKTIATFIVIILSIVYYFDLKSSVKEQRFYSFEILFATFGVVFIMSILLCILINSGEGILPNSVRNPKAQILEENSSTKDSLIRMRAMKKVLREKAEEYKQSKKF